MRSLTPALLALALALPAGAAGAQVQQNNPDAANASFARQGEIRALRQQRTADFNTLTMQAQRNVRYQPDAPYRPVRIQHRHGTARGGFNTSVCVGC